MNVTRIVRREQTRSTHQRLDLKSVCLHTHQVAILTQRGPPNNHSLQSNIFQLDHASASSVLSQTPTTTGPAHRTSPIVSMRSLLGIFPIAIFLRA